MGTAYFVNATPTEVSIQLNGSEQHVLAAISVGDKDKSVTGPAWGAKIEAFKSKNVFGSGSGEPIVNEVLFNSPQSPITRRYHITSAVSNVLNLYFFLFEDTIIGEDQTGSSAGITIIKLSALKHEV